MPQTPSYLIFCMKPLKHCESMQFIMHCSHHSASHTVVHKKVHKEKSCMFLAVTVALNMWNQCGTRTPLQCECAVSSVAISQEHQAVGTSSLNWLCKGLHGGHKNPMFTGSLSYLRHPKAVQWKDSQHCKQLLTDSGKQHWNSEMWTERAAGQILKNVTSDEAATASW